MFKTKLGKINAIIVFAMLTTCVSDLAIETDREKRVELRREQERNDPKRMARNLCKIWIENVLHDPESASFGRYWEWPVSVDEAQLFTTRATIRAKNAYGATIKSTFTCVVHPTDNNQWLKVDLVES